MAYEGYNGQVEIDGHTLVITRTGIVAKAAFGRNVPPRRIPLQALSGVRFKKSSPLTNGWIQILPGGEDKPAPTMTTAGGDPDVVLFTHGKRKPFAQLHEWLLNVVQENQMQGVDPAAVTFDAGQSRQDRLKERRTEQNVELYGAGGERQDIAEAADRMGWTFGGRRELKKLPEHLFDNETVRFIAQGAYLGKQGIAVLTNQRLLFVFHGFMSQSIEDFPLDRISSVASKAGMVRGDLKVHASGNDAVISNIVKEDLKFLADALRQRLSEGANGKLGASGPQQQPDLMDQLRKLAELRDAGILTPDEFEAKKADILSRL